ncbi:MAG TPA: hypothetical protein VGK06_14635 [Methanosarcina sp.]
MGWCPNARANEARSEE